MAAKATNAVQTKVGFKVVMFRGVANERFLATLSECGSAASNAGRLTSRVCTVQRDNLANLNLVNLPTLWGRSGEGQSSH
jgi:hypothetical protein